MIDELNAIHPLLPLVAGALLLLIAALVADLVVKHIVVRAVQTLAKRSHTTWDDALVDTKVFSRLSHLVPAVILHALAPLVYRDFPQIASTLLRCPRGLADPINGGSIQRLRPDEQAFIFDARA